MKLLRHRNNSHKNWLQINPVRQVELVSSDVKNGGQGSGRGICRGNPWARLLTDSPPRARWAPPVGIPKLWRLLPAGSVCNPLPGRHTGRSTGIRPNNGGSQILDRPAMNGQAVITQLEKNQTVPTRRGRLLSGAPSRGHVCCAQLHKGKISVDSQVLGRRRENRSGPVSLRPQYSSNSSCSTGLPVKESFHLKFKGELLSYPGWTQSACTAAWERKHPWILEEWLLPVARAVWLYRSIGCDHVRIGCDHVYSHLQWEHSFVPLVWMQCQIIFYECTRTDRYALLQRWLHVQSHIIT